MEGEVFVRPVAEGLAVLNVVAAVGGDLKVVAGQFRLFQRSDLREQAGELRLGVVMRQEVNFRAAVCAEEQAPPLSPVSSIAHLARQTAEGRRG